MRCILTAAFIVATAAASSPASGPEAMQAGSWAGFRGAYPSLPVQAFGSDRTLIETLQNARSPQERAAAAAALRAYVIRSYDARAALVDCLTGRPEREDMVRRAAAKTLANAVNDSDVREALAETAGSPRESEDLRALCLKAMYRMTNTQAGMLMDVLDSAREPLALRLAAAWGLFKAVNQADVRRALTDAVRDADEPALRAEALKSLFGAIHTVEVRGVFLRLAQDRREETELRALAALGLIKRTNESEVRRVLQDLAEGDPDTEVRVAALKALSRVVDEPVAERFHLDQIGAGLWRDPLLYE
jgi:HEAT repeat protein